MMEPIALEGSTGNYRIIERCLRCRLERPIALAKNDNMKTVLAIAEYR